jgi:DNA-binding MarR family transcriptional regulator
MARLRDELRQTKPFGSLEEEVYLELQLTADRLAGAVVRELKTVGLSHAQYNVLRILRGAGEAGATCGEIGERMINRDPDVTRLLDRLVEQGLARRERDERDRRVVVTTITDAARDLMRKVEPRLEVLLRRTLGPLGPKRLRNLAELLEAARDVEP